jgi:hypothetical protein
MNNGTERPSETKLVRVLDRLAATTWRASRRSLVVRAAVALAALGGARAGTALGQRGSSPQQEDKPATTETPTATTHSGRSVQQRDRATEPPQPPGDRPSRSNPAWEPFAEGFEHGDLRRWVAVDGLEVQRQEVLDGAHAARARSDGSRRAYARTRLSWPRHHLYARLRFKVLQLGAQPVSLLRLLTDGTAPVIDLAVDANGSLIAVTGPAAARKSQTRVGLRAWHELRLRVRVAAGDGTGEIDVWLDGERLAMLSGPAVLGKEPIVLLQLGDDGRGRIFDVVYDDLLVDVARIPADQRFARSAVVDAGADGTGRQGAIAADAATPPAAGGLRGEYFDHQDLTGLALTRVDPKVDFNWASGSPDPAIAPDSFSVRWSGQVRADFAETYTFYTTSNDGVRLWVDGRQLINNWTDHAATENRGTVALQAGRWYPLRLEYYEGTGNATIKLSYSSPSTAKQVIPADRLRPEPGTA